MRWNSIYPLLRVLMQWMRKNEHRCDLVHSKTKVAPRRKTIGAKSGAWWNSSRAGYEEENSTRIDIHMFTCPPCVVPIGHLPHVNTILIASDDIEASPCSLGGFITDASSAMIAWVSKTAVWLFPPHGVSSKLNMTFVCGCG